MTGITANFFTFSPGRAYDFVTCLQVLEHIGPARKFARKLFTLADRVLISVPYQWPAGLEKSHCQDPVDFRKLRRWTGRDPTYWVIVAEPLTELPGRNRLIAYYHPPGADFSLRKVRRTMRPENRPDEPGRLIAALPRWLRPRFPQRPA